MSLASTIDRIRESSHWRNLSDISLLQWVCGLAVGMITGISSVIHHAQLEVALTFFIVSAAAALYIGSRLSRWWRDVRTPIAGAPAGEAKRRTTKSYFTHTPPVIAVAIFIAFYFIYQKLTSMSPATKPPDVVTSRPSPEGKSEPNTPADVPKIEPIPAAKPPKKQPRIELNPLPTAKQEPNPSGPSVQPTYSVTNPSGSVINQGSAVNAPQTVNNFGPPPPVFTLKLLKENVKLSENQYQTDYQLDVETKTAFPSLHVRAEGAGVGTVNGTVCLTVLRIIAGAATGNHRDSTSGYGFCDTHAQNVRSGQYLIEVLSTTPTKVHVTYEPD
jgi:hypothetical protein